MNMYNTLQHVSASGQAETKTTGYAKLSMTQDLSQLK
jgi:hypothetical protein